LICGSSGKRRERRKWVVSRIHLYSSVNRQI
jgi:hypothetical protein